MSTGSIQDQNSLVPIVWKRLGPLLSARGSSGQNSSASRRQTESYEVEATGAGR